MATGTDRPKAAQRTLRALEVRAVLIYPSLSTYIRHPFWWPLDIIIRARLRLNQGLSLVILKRLRVLGNAAHSIADSFEAKAQFSWLQAFFIG